MAVVFKDLHTDSGVKSLDDHLSGKSYVSGDALTKDDIKVYGAVLEKPSDSFPNASKWYSSVEQQLAARYVDEAPAGDDDDDDLDLFGDETEEEKKAAEEREASKKASSKKKESGKSSILLDVKPWDDETDMKKLEETVRSVQMEGLTWGASKLVPVGFGIKKLTIMMTIIDDLVSVDDLIEDHLTSEPANEYIQSCDIVAFNKI
ncbi:Elongation factor 1-beta 1 [Bienertia sinuspersici]